MYEITWTVDASSDEAALEILAMMRTASEAMAAVTGKPAVPLRLVKVLG